MICFNGKGKKGQAFLWIFALSLLLLLGYLTNILLTNTGDETVRETIGSQVLTVHEFNVASETLLFVHQHTGKNTFDKAIVATIEQAGLPKSCQVFSVPLFTKECVITPETLDEIFQENFRSNHDVYLSALNSPLAEENYTVTFSAGEKETLATSITAENPIIYEKNNVRYSFIPDISFTMPHNFAELYALQETLDEALPCLHQDNIGDCLPETFQNTILSDNILTFDYGPLTYQTINGETITIHAGVDLDSFIGKSIT